MIKIKRGQYWKAIDTPNIIKIETKHKKAGWWMTSKINGSKHCHKISEKLLFKYYKLLNNEN